MALFGRFAFRVAHRVLLPGHRALKLGQQSLLLIQRASLPGHQSLFPGQRALLIGQQSSLPAHRALLLPHQALKIGHRVILPGHRALYLHDRVILIGERETKIGGGFSGWNRLNPETEIGEHARPRALLDAPRVQLLCAAACKTPGTCSCVRCFPRGRGKRHARRVRSPFNFGFRVKTPASVHQRHNFQCL